MRILRLICHWKLFSGRVGRFKITASGRANVPRDSFRAVRCRRPVGARPHMVALRRVVNESAAFSLQRQDFETYPCLIAPNETRYHCCKVSVTRSDILSRVRVNTESGHSGAWIFSSFFLVTWCPTDHELQSNFRHTSTLCRAAGKLHMNIWTCPNFFL